MRFLAIALLASGCMGLIFFYQGVVKGQIKWNPEKTLTGSQARMLGLASLIVGLAMLAAGGYVAYQVLSR